MESSSSRKVPGVDKEEKMPHQDVAVGNLRSWTATLEVER